jgi:monoterpene epsilon-lactone hydrolase
MTTQQRTDLAAMLGHGPASFTPEPVEKMRADFTALMARFPVAPVRTTDVTVAGRGALLVEPEAGVTRPGTILYFHGGSFALGSPRTALGLTASLVTRTGMRSISVDYRLAPEHPFPAGIHDRALLDDGADPGSIVFAGDSAGGGLTVTTTLAARDAGLPRPGALVAFSPLFDHTHAGASMDTKQGIDPFFTREAMAYTGKLYLGGQDPRQPLAAPAILADLTGLPPILLQVGTNELLLDDSVRLADRARDAGADVVLDITAGVPHVFQAFTDRLDEAGLALDRAALFITQQVRAQAPAIR